MQLGATEIQIFHPEAVKPPELPHEITQNISVIHSKLSNHPAVIMSELSEALEDMLTEEMRVAVCLNVTMPIVANLALLHLSQNLTEFHQQERACLGPSASVFYYYVVSSQRITGLPLIPGRPTLCFHVFRILSESSLWLDKQKILEQIHYVKDTVTMDKLNNTLIIMDNWLRLFPGYEVRNTRSRRKEYRLRDLSNLGY